MTTNLTTEIQIDSSSLTGYAATSSSAAAPSSTPAGTDHEHSPGAPTASSEDIINNGTKVTRTQSAKAASDTKSTSVPSQAVRRTRTVSSSSFTSVEENQAGELAEEAASCEGSCGSSEDLGLLRRTRKKVVNVFK